MQITMSHFFCYSLQYEHSHNYLQECRFTHRLIFFLPIYMKFYPGIYIYQIALPCPYICTCHHRDSLVGVATIDNCWPLTVASVLPPVGRFATFATQLLLRLFLRLLLRFLLRLLCRPIFLSKFIPLENCHTSRRHYTQRIWRRVILVPRTDLACDQTKVLPPRTLF